MTKETLTLDKIAFDLKRVASQNWSHKRFELLLPTNLPILAILVGILLHQ